MDLTKEEIIHIFGLYWKHGAKHKDAQLNDEMYYVMDTLLNKEYRIEQGERMYDISEWTLQLIPLKNITDEHMIAIGETFTNSFSLPENRHLIKWKITCRDENLIVAECEDYRIFIYFNDDSFMDFEELYHGEENIEAHGGESESCSSYGIIEIIDQLRAWGYALLYKGQSLFELGVAKEKII